MKVRRGPDKPELDLSLCGKEARETRKSGGEGGERAGEEDQTPCQPSTLSLFAASRRAEGILHYPQACSAPSLLTNVRNDGCLGGSAWSHRCPRYHWKKLSASLALNLACCVCVIKGRLGQLWLQGELFGPKNSSKRNAWGDAKCASWPHSSSENRVCDFS